jgi:outer membrane protein assembly factor BamB
MNMKVGTWLLAGALSAAPALANDWAKWRGPEQNGVSRETNLPDAWTPEGENLAWSAPVGGMSCPIVMNGMVYSFTRVGEVQAGEGLTATVDPGPKTQEALTCVDEKTGNVVWQHLNNMFMTDAPFHRLGWSSPVGDPETGRVYAMGTQATLVCCDAKTGKLIWQHQMTEEFGMISTFGGRTASPALDGDQLFITGVSFGWGNNAGSQHRIFAFNKNTGELNWTSGTGGIPVDAPYGTPVISVIGGQRLVLFPGGDGGIHAFQARTGKKVWTFKASKHGMNSSVVVQGDKVFATWDLDNFGSNKLGGVACLDGSKVTDGAPAVVWKDEGIEDGFPTATIVDDTLYCITDNAVLYALDAKTGEEKAHKGMGTIGKASLTYGDGKLYVAEANGRFSIVKPETGKFKLVNRAEFMDKPGREYVIFGSPAISDGHIFLATATKLYCIGPKEFTPQKVAVPPMAQEAPAEGHPEAAMIQVRPADVVTHPGQKTTFTAFAFDAMGRSLGEVKAEKWEVGQLTMPPPPVRPKELMRPNSAAAAQGNASTSKPVAAPVTPPTPAAPVKVGNLDGTVDDSGTFTADNKGHTPQGGGVIAHVGKLEGVGRVRVFPPLPWKADFEKAVVGKPPLTWLGAGMKFAVKEEPGNPSNKVLVKLTDIPLFARARTYMGTEDMSNYTVQADVNVDEKVYNDGPTEVHKLPDVGVIDSRYCLELKGANQTLNLYGWPAAIPRNELVPGLATHAAIPFKWKAKAWYVEKIMVQQEGDKAIVKGKVWERGQPEPKDWTIQMEDPTPNTNGAAGLWGFSNDLEIYYDNIVVTPNEAPTAGAGGLAAPGNDGHSSAVVSK